MRARPRPRSAVLRFACGSLLAAAALALVLSSCGGGDATLEVSPATLSWGDVRMGTNPSRTLTVTNRTPRDVVIVPKPNCGCLGLGPNTRRMLAPGEQLAIPVVLISGKTGGLGPLEGKWLDLHSSDRAIESVRVPLEATIFLPYEVELAFHELGRLEGQASDLEPRVTTIRPTPGNRLEIERMEVVPPDLFEVTHATTEAGALEVRFALNPQAHRTPMRFGVTTQVYLKVHAQDGTTSRSRVRIETSGFWARPQAGAR